MKLGALVHFEVHRTKVFEILFKMRMSIERVINTIKLPRIGGFKGSFRRGLILIILSALASLSIITFLSAVPVRDLNRGRTFKENKETGSDDHLSDKKNRNNVTILLGVPTVRRDNSTYLIQMLHNLIANMNEAEQSETLIVVFIAETDADYVNEIGEMIKFYFGKYCDDGLVEVISPPTSYYSCLETLKITFNDTMERVRWRSKENLDCAYLMTYAQPRAKFYMMLEDDVLTKPGFITKIKNFIKISDKSTSGTWFMLSFCNFGSIGKLFRSSDISHLASFLTIFFNDKPIDWLLDAFITAKFCNPEEGDYCNDVKKKVSPLLYPSLFQHIGKTSSLKGKVQRMVDIKF